MIRQTTELVLGRGEVYFESFAPGTRAPDGKGERYLGNTTTFQVSRVVSSLDRFTSYRGQQVEREGATVREAHSIQFVTDHISIENVALWFGGDPVKGEVKGNNIKSETFQAWHNRFIQLGKTFVAVGVRHVDNVVVLLNGIKVPAASNWALDKDFGRLQILADAPNIPDGSLITVEFEWRTTTTETTRSKLVSAYGALRFMATNPAGIRRNYLFPFVKLTARGAIDLKGDQWQQMPFDADAMRLTPSTEQVYVDSVISVGTTEDEQAIIDGGLKLDQFPYWEDQLHIITNIDLPAAGLDVPVNYP